MSETPTTRVQEIWQCQPVEGIKMSADEIRNRALKFEKRIFWRNAREYAGALIAVVVFAVSFVKTDDLGMRAAFVVLSHVSLPLPIASVIPPCTIGECPQIEFVRPRGSVLFREVNVGLCDLGWKHESVVFLASGFSQLLELFRPQHLPQGVGRIHGAVDHDVDDVDSFRRELRIE